MPTPVKYNYIFNEWYTEESAGTKVEETDIYSLQEDTTLYAQYTKITYTTLASSYSCANHSNANASLLSYTGNCTLNDDGSDNYYISFTTSGTLTIGKNLSLDVFAARGGEGGGGGGCGKTHNTSDIYAGSGGGGSDGGTSGSDGGNGGKSWLASGGTGQGTTTREFGEASGTLYSTGGYGGNYATGGNNTGDGGGGGPNGHCDGGNGCSGIVVIRNAR